MCKLILMLFTHDPELARAAEDSGIDRIVVDFEFRGKKERQSEYHLEVNKATFKDLSKIRQAVTIPVVARINPISDSSRNEIETIINEGADILMLPMFRTRKEIEIFIGCTNKRAKTNLLFETKDSVALAPEMEDLPFDEYYIGLNDMAIEHDLLFAYDVLKLGVIAHIRSALSRQPFGFGGITIIGKGTPLATTAILQQMAYYGCSLAILRRAFKRDIAGKSMRAEVERIKDFYESLR